MPSNQMTSFLLLQYCISNWIPLLEDTLPLLKENQESIWWLGWTELQNQNVVILFVAQYTVDTQPLWFVGASLLYKPDSGVNFIIMDLMMSYVKT